MSIYKVSMIKAKEAYYALSPEEKKKLADDSKASVRQCGGKSVITLNTEWSSEEWTYMVVTEFPNVEAVMKQRELAAEFDSNRYLDTQTYLGTKSDT